MTGEAQDNNQPQKGHRRRYNSRIIGGILGFAMLTVYLSAAVYTQVDSAFFPGTELDLGVEVLPGIESNVPEQGDINERINILFLGLDLRRDEPDNTPARTDSVMVLSMDPYSDTAGAFSIPRDTWVDIPTGTSDSECADYDAPLTCAYTSDRINVAYQLGEYSPYYEDYKGGGAQLVKDTIQHNFDIPIDYYVVLNFNNFIEIIDELGGIDVDIPEYAYDPAYDDCNTCGAYPVEFAPGHEHMDGERALAYARIRHSDDDFKRIERQQLVLRATAQKAADLGTVFGNARELYNKYKDAVRTDISDLQIPGLARLAKDIGVDTLRTVSMAEATYPCGYECPGAVLLWNEEKVQELKARVFSPQREGDGATVMVLNGTPTPDLARQFKLFLAEQGITSERVRIDELVDGPLYDTTMVVDLDGKSETTELIADWLSLPASRIVSANEVQAEEFRNISSNVVVVLGADVNLAALDSRNASIQEDTTGG